MRKNLLQTLTTGFLGFLPYKYGGTGIGTIGTANQIPTVNAGASALNYLYATNQSTQTVDNPTFNSLALTAPLSVANGGTGSSTAFGIPQIMAVGNVIAQNAAVSSIAAFTTPNDGTNRNFRIGAYAAITAISAGTLTVQVSFTDQNSNAQTLSFVVMGLTSAGLTSTGFDAFSPVNIRCKPNTAITVKTTFTGVSITYDCGGTIERIY